MSELRRVTINLQPRADAALGELIEVTNYSQTEVINRALILYQIMQRLGDGEEFTVVTEGGRRQRTIYLL